MFVMRYNDSVKKIKGAGLMNQNQAIEQAKQVKAHYEKMLLKMANVVGVGIGFKQKNNNWTDQLAIIVNVRQKKALADLPTGDVIPSELDGIPTDVQEVGEIKPL